MEELELEMPTVEQMKEGRKDVRNCIYDGCTVIGTFKLLEDHVASAHGITRLVYHCVHEECKDSNETFNSLQARRAHHKNEHGWG